MIIIMMMMIIIIAIVVVVFVVVVVVVSLYPILQNEAWRYIKHNIIHIYLFF